MAQATIPKTTHFTTQETKKVLGKMKDEYGGDVIEEVVAVRPKMYTVNKAGKKI